MKPTDFIKENHHIVQAVVEMHDDHEIQMAREQCYNSASNAIEIHRMLKHITERQGLEGWVQEKITLANDYLRQVKEWMEYEIMNKINTVSQSGNDVMSMRETASGGSTGGGNIATTIASQYAHKSTRNKIPAAQRKKYDGKDWMIKRSDLNDSYKRESLKTIIDEIEPIMPVISTTKLPTPPKPAGTAPMTQNAPQQPNAAANVQIRTQPQIPINQQNLEKEIGDKLKDPTFGKNFAELLARVMQKK
jgi:hypothetical protein